MPAARASRSPDGSVGPLLQFWRRARNLSQLALAADAEISSRHLSFIETGRANPSREMVMLLASALDIPLREPLVPDRDPDAINSGFFNANTYDFSYSNPD